LIEIKDLFKTFGKVGVLDGVSLVAPRQTNTAVLGASGSGKTTLLRLIAGLEKPDRGEILINGSTASSDSFILEPHKRGIGFVFQSPALWPHMTVAQNINFGLQGKPGKETRERLNFVLRATSLEGMEGRYPHQLSGGEARRVSLARTLAPMPSYILMDEPLINIDVELKYKLLQMIKTEIQAAGACLIYVSHDPWEIKEISDRVFSLKNGILEEVPKPT
jgi:iron(III) transport system ATP-binding protein